MVGLKRPQNEINARAGPANFDGKLSNLKAPRRLVRSKELFCNRKNSLLKRMTLLTDVRSEALPTCIITFIRVEQGGPPSAVWNREAKRKEIRGREWIL